jgi:NADP-dependent 3-hydroxy acid dehydrogenase YdfG
MKQNNNRVALVTGANKGIGFEIARGLEDGPTEGFFSSAGRERW